MKKKKLKNHISFIITYLVIPFSFLILTLQNVIVSPVIAKEVTFKKIEGVGDFLPHLFIDPSYTFGVGDTLERVFSTLIGVFTMFAGLMFIIYFILGAFNWITSAGKTEQIEKAKTQMYYAVIGLVVVVAAYSFIYILGEVVGLKILEPAEQLKEIKHN